MASSVRLRRESREPLIVWSILCFATLYGILGAAVGIPHGDQSVSLSQALHSMSVSAIFTTPSQWLIVLVTAIITCVGYFAIKDHTVRLMLLFVGFLVPPWLIAEAMFVTWAISPLMIFMPLFAQNGEFYSDEMPVFYAGSLWMLMCAVLLVRCIRQMMRDYESWMA